jgi:GT2 family glycosyltransferase
MHVSIDIVVVNYHSPADLNEFVESLERFPVRADASLTIVDVDVDPYLRFFEWGGKPGRTIGLRGNVGYARACNYGAAIGARDHIALFNADVVLTKGAIDLCHDALQNQPDWAILGPCQVDNGNRIRHAGIFGTLDAPVHRGWNENNHGQYNDVRDAVTVSGSAYFVRRSVWDELTGCSLYRDVAPEAQGAFLPTSHYFEETWCSYHAQTHGHRVVYYGYVTIVHKWHRASPVGGWAEQQMPISRSYFREACDHHGILHD